MDNLQEEYLGLLVDLINDLKESVIVAREELQEGATAKQAFEALLTRTAEVLSTYVVQH